MVRQRSITGQEHHRGNRRSQAVPVSDIARHGRVSCGAAGSGDERGHDVGGVAVQAVAARSYRIVVRGSG